jgi:predicted anti-sigma-YlaC factor YlaD
MNCFESRQEFPALWRKTVTAERQSEMTAHLKGCSKCDHAFRVFALTAPVLYSEIEPAGRVAPNHLRIATARRGALVSRGSARPPRVLAMCAGVMILFAASMAAYLSATVPVGSFADEITNSESVIDFPSLDSSTASNDFAG